MHDVSISATGLRGRQVSETTRVLHLTARRWTAERGLAGFTVEELCEEVGVSRRTFFNYYACKEDAVLGVSVRDDHAAAEERFLRGGGSGPGLSSTLVDDLAELVLDRWERLDLTPEDARDLVDAFHREPRLMARMLEVVRAHEREDTALVERRERLPTGDLRAVTAVHLLVAVLRASVEASLQRDGGEPLRDALAQRLAAARAVFSA
jgi:AcrR family transcriptional regulator